MSENTGVTNTQSNRERYAARLRERYPDREYADDEALFGQINDDYDEYDSQLERYRADEKAITEMFSDNPRSAAFLMDWQKGEDPIVGLIRKYGDDFKAALEDPDKLEELAEANKQYAERVAQERDFEQQYQSNMDTVTYPAIEQVKTEDGLTDDDIDEAMVWLIGVMKDGILGKFTPESIRMAIKAIKHDGDVELADREGEVRGRNARIEEKLRRRGQSDGTASLTSRNAGGKASPREVPDLGALGRFDSSNIWERGGEKRRSAK